MCLAVLRADLCAMPTHPDSSDDSGLSLVEVLVAMVLVSALLTALASNLISALQAATYARHVQSAGDLLMKEVEELRALPWDALGHDDADLAGDPQLTVVAGARSAPVDGAYEPVVVLGSPGVLPHIRAATLPPAAAATVTRYVTAPVGCLCRRVQVQISWTERDQPKQRSTSTLVYSAAPVGRTSRAFVLGASTLTVPDAPRGTAAPVGVLLSNDGQQQPFRLTATVTRGATVQPWSVTWYADPDRDGRVDPGEQRLDPTVPGTAVLEAVGSGTTIPVTAVVAVPSGVPTGAVTVAVTATSPAEPGAGVQALFDMRVT